MKKIYYDWRDVEGAVLELARQIQNTGWKPDYIVGVTRGGAVPAILLSQYLNIPMYPLHVSLRDGDDHDCVSDLGMAEDAFGYHRTDDLPGSSNPHLRKNILIVDDINDSGATIQWIMKDWPSGCLPNNTAWDEIWHENVRFAVLTNNLYSKSEVDYYCWEVNKAEDDCWLVYPWEEFWKNGNRH